MLYSKKNVQYTGKIGRRPNNYANGNSRSDKNITEKFQKFSKVIRTNKTYKSPLGYLCDIGKVNYPGKIDSKITCMLETDMHKE